MDVPFSIANCWQTLSLPGTKPYQAPVIRSMVQIHMVHPHLDIGVQHPPTMEVLQPWHQWMQVPRKPRRDSLEHQGCFAGKTRQTKMCWGTCSAFSSKKPGSNDDSTYVFFPPFQAILKHFWSDLLAHRPGAQTVHPRCSPSARHPRINHLVTIGDHFLPPNFWHTTPRNPEYALVLIYSCLPFLPLFGGVLFCSFGIGRSWNEYDKHTKHTQNAGITGFENLQETMVFYHQI